MIFFVLVSDHGHLGFFELLLVSGVSAYCAFWVDYYVTFSFCFAFIKYVNDGLSSRQQKHLQVIIPTIIPKPIFTRTSTNTPISTLFIFTRQYYQFIS